MNSKGKNLHIKIKSVTTGSQVINLAPYKRRAFDNPIAPVCRRGVSITTETQFFLYVSQNRNFLLTLHTFSLTFPERLFLY